MRRRSNLLVLLGIAFFVVGGVIVFLLTNDDDDAGTEAGGPVTVIVGTEDIPAGTLADDLIEAGRLKAVEVDAAQVTPGAVQSVNQLAGRHVHPGLRRQPADHQRRRAAPEPHLRGARGLRGRRRADRLRARRCRLRDRRRPINLYGVFSTVTGDVAVPRAELLLTNVEVLDVDLTIPPRRGTAPVDPSQPRGPEGQQHGGHLPPRPAGRRRREGHLHHRVREPVRLPHG